MEVRELIDTCLSYHEAYIDYPFGEIPIYGNLFRQKYPNIAV